jgi:Endodeoxyribonuclease RusA
MTPADVDNLAKLLLDSFNECIYEDDKIIDHLNLLRIAYGGVEEYIEVRISDSNVNTHTDVLYHGLNHVWGMDELLLENFYEAD